MPELNQRVAVTKRMIKEGLMRLLGKKSLEKITITELCQEAGELAGGAYFLARQWIMEEIPMPPEDVAAIALNILDKDRVF